LVPIIPILTTRLQALIISDTDMSLLVNKPNFKTLFCIKSFFLMMLIFEHIFYFEDEITGIFHVDVYLEISFIILIFEYYAFLTYW